MPQISYKQGYKYQLVADYSLQLDFYPAQAARSTFLELSAEGLLLIKSGYCWDGASGPAIDSKNFMRASLVHDALYQMLRNEQLPADLRLQVDQQMLSILKQDGMSWPRRWWVYHGVRIFGGKAARQPKQVLTAPN